MASLSLSPQFETNAISNGKVIELLQQLKSAKAHGKNYIKVTPLLVSHLLHNRLLRFSTVELLKSEYKGSFWANCNTLRGATGPKLRLKWGAKSPQKWNHFYQNRLLRFEQKGHIENTVVQKRLLDTSINVNSNFDWYHGFLLHFIS